MVYIQIGIQLSQSNFLFSVYNRINLSRIIRYKTPRKKYHPKNSKMLIFIFKKHSTRTLPLQLFT